MGCNTDFSVPIPNTNTCRVTEGPFTGETTTDHMVLLTGPEAGAQIGTCESNGLISYVRVPHASASPTDLSELLSRQNYTPASGFVRYDALASRRAYKEPLELTEIERILREQFTGDSLFVDQVLARHS